MSAMVHRTVLMVLMNQIGGVVNAARTTEAATMFVSTGQLGLSASAARVMYYREGTAMISMSAVSMALAVNSAKTHTAPSPVSVFPDMRWRKTQQRGRPVRP